MIKELDADRNPNKTVSLLHAIRWTVHSWQNLVTTRTIEKCFWKSTCIKKPVDAVLKDPQQVEERAQLQVQILSIPNLSNLIPIDQFIQPAEEQIVDQVKDITEALVERYTVIPEKKKCQKKEKILR